MTLFCIFIGCLGLGGVALYLIGACIMALHDGALLRQEIAIWEHLGGGW